jgi:hypothetical protein
VTHPRPLYLHPDGTPVFGVFHPAAEGVAGRTAVLFCPPFGYDAICSHRGLRAWAKALAASGRPALRLDLPGSGDSAGTPRDPGLAASWPHALAAGATWLRAETGATRVVAIGVGLGGLLATQAVALGAPIDDLVLWANPRNGRLLVRELGAFARLGVTVGAGFDFDAAGMAPLPEGATEGGGYLLSGETVAALKALDLTKLELPDAARRHVLLLARDQISVDDRLTTALEAQGAQVEVSDGPGYSELTDEPHRAAVPHATIALVDAWLARTEGDAPEPGVTPAPAAAPLAPERSESLPLDGLVERPITLDLPGGERADGILAEPAAGTADAPFTVVLLNVGAERRIGFNRMWVEAARRWAPQGVPVVRVDLPGIGDAGGSDAAWTADGALYEPELIDQLGATLDGLQTAGLPPRFQLVGVCASAYWAFQQTLRDPRVTRLTLVNPFMLMYDGTRGKADEVHQLARLRSPSALREALADGVSVALVVRKLGALWAVARRQPAKLLGRLTARRAGGDPLDLALDRLRDRDVAFDLLFSDGEPLQDVLTRSGHLARLARWPNIVRTPVVGPPASHTIQLVRMQPAVHDLLDAAVAAERARASTGATAAAPAAAAPATADLR